MREKSDIEKSDIEEYVRTHRTCQHEKWFGIKEVDAYCANCGMDEFEVGKENEKLYTEAYLEAMKSLGFSK